MNLQNAASFVDGCKNFDFLHSFERFAQHRIIPHSAAFHNKWRKQAFTYITENCGFKMEPISQIGVTLFPRKDSTNGYGSH